MSGEDRGRDEQRLGARFRPSWPYRWPGLTLLIGLAVTVTLTLTAHALFTDNEQRLLRLRQREAEQVVSASLPTVQTPLASAAALADATNGNRKKFRTFISPYVGLGAGHPFVSVSLWRLSAIDRGPKVVVGSAPALSGATAAASWTGQPERAAERPGDAGGPLATSRLCPHRSRAVCRLRRDVLPKSRYSPAMPSSAFSDLDYAIYLGTSETPPTLW